jgi:kynurenine--oxoglutarate transaminase/cysteine-S-conjugate beta-lyase/glutamine--phenylpyruvate transaminase
MSSNLMSHRLNGFDSPTVWHEFTPLAIKHKAMNLGQGFPGKCCDITILLPPKHY